MGKFLAKDWRRKQQNAFKVLKKEKKLLKRLGKFLKAQQTLTFLTFSPVTLQDWV